MLMPKTEGFLNLVNIIDSSSSLIKNVSLVKNQMNSNLVFQEARPNQNSLKA
jgi:hypothetical protein